MLNLNRTICALATPPGEGGIAVVRLSGPAAYPVAERVFRPANPAKKVAEAKGYTALFGHYLLDGQRMDEVVALFYRAPHSYTGEDVVELSCHGGRAMADGLVQACLKAGAAPAGPGEFTRRALENGRMSLTQAEAVMEIIGAAGRQGAALAAAQLGGALAGRIGAIQADLTELASHLAAWVDFPEEDVPELEPARLDAALAGAEARLQQLIDGYGAGAVLRHGVDTAIIGRPNVGKSTLLNLLAGFERAIVTPVAGTTRDLVEQAVMLGQTPLNLWDTAGLRETDDVVEAEGIRRSNQKFEEAGLILAVFDGSAPATEEDRALAARCKGRRAIAVLNKEDLTAAPGVFDQTLLEGCFDRVVTLSATEPAARDTLAQAVDSLMGTAGLDPNAGALCSQRQLAAAVAARDALAGARQARADGFDLDAVGVCLDDALEALCRLTGEDAGEAVIDQVFSRFCVGK